MLISYVLFSKGFHKMQGTIIFIIDLKTQKITNVIEEVEKLEHLCTVGGESEKVQLPWKEYRSSSKN